MLGRFNVSDHGTAYRAVNCMADFTAAEVMMVAATAAARWQRRGQRRWWNCNVSVVRGT